jgi:cytidylate kinase
MGAYNRNYTIKSLFTDQKSVLYLLSKMASNLYESLVNKALHWVNLREYLREKFSLTEESFIHPFITVAREPGSGGAPVAKAVAEKLGFEFIDDQIIEEIARSTKRRKAIIKEIDEKSRTRIEDIVHSLVNLEYVDEETYISELVRSILSYAHKGHCVILGRGGNFITPFAKGLHVSITAPYEVRVQRAMHYEGLSESQAKEVIAKVEDERTAFVKQYFRRNLSKRNIFDLTLNTTYFDVPQARDIIIEAYKQKFPRL